MFESDVPITTRVLVDKYGDSDEVSEGHREIYFDIEVEVTDGFPYPEDAKDRVTAIAVHNSEEDEYHCLVLDDKKKLTLKSKDNVIIESFENEFDLLQRFFLLYLVCS